MKTKKTLRDKLSVVCNENKVLKMQLNTALKVVNGSFEEIKRLREKIEKLEVPND